MKTRCIAVLSVSLMVLWAASGRGAMAADMQPQGVLPLVTLTGTDSHVTKPEYLRVESEEEWVKVWQRHKGVKESKDYDFYYNPLKLPSIDFKQCMVIAVFQGNGWNSAGLTTVPVEQEKDRVILGFRSKGFQTVGPNGGGKQVAVYGFFVLQRSDKPVVVKEQVVLILDPNVKPSWHQRAILTNGSYASINIEVFDLRRKSAVAMKKETVEVQLPESFESSQLVVEVDNPQPLYKIHCHLTSFSDVTRPILASTWLYEVVEDKQHRYHLFKGGLSIRAWSAAEGSLDAVLAGLKEELIGRATAYRAGLRQMQQ